MGFLLAGGEHLYRDFVSVDHTLGEQRFAQGIDQRMKLYASVPDQLRRRRAGNGQAGTAEDILPVQRQVVSELRHHQVGQHACGGEALVDHLGRHRRLFRTGGSPFFPRACWSTVNTRVRSRAFRWLLLLRVEAGSRNRTGCLRRVTDHGMRALRWQRRALGLLARLSRDSRRVYRLQLVLDGSDVGVGVD